MFGEDGGLALFLLIAPLAPVAGVAASSVATLTPPTSLRRSRRTPDSGFSCSDRWVSSRRRSLSPCSSGWPCRASLGSASPGSRRHWPAWRPRSHCRASSAAPPPSRGRRHRLGRGRGSSDPGTRPGRGRRADHAGGSDRAHSHRHYRRRPSSRVLRTHRESGMNTIALKTVSKSYANPRAGRHRPDLAPGHRRLLGPNGAGKTALLRIIATALAADSGEARVLGFDPDTPDGRVGIRRRLGYVPQETGFPRGFTAFGFVDYMAILKEWSDPTYGTPRSVGRSTWPDYRRRDQTRVGPVRRATATSGAGPGPAGTPGPARPRRAHSRTRP